MAVEMPAGEYSELQWRAAVLAVERAQRLYRDTLLSAEATDRAIDLAWLGLWRAERDRDNALQAST